MKVEDLLLFSPQTVRSESRQSGEGDFAQCLAEALKAGASQTAGAAPLARLGPPEGAGNSPQNLVEATLSRLELFQEALGRPDISLKNISSLVDSLEEDSRQLQSTAKKLSPGSPLRQVLEEAAALSWVECFKFRRGDYV